MLNTTDIRCRLGQTNILQGISAEFRPGELNVILGPNGSGKSTFLKICSGGLTRYEGAVTYKGKPLTEWDTNILAGSRAVMSQQPDLHFPLTVEEVVMMGRYPHFRMNPRRKDRDICRMVMEKMNLLGFAGRNYLTLSGGEKQRVQFARVLAQIWEPPEQGDRYLFLDEPLNNLDISYQQEFLETAAAFKKENTVLIAVLHDINLAAHYGDRLFFLKEGRLIASGPPAAMITRERLREVFNIQAELIPHPRTQVPMVLYT